MAILAALAALSWHFNARPQHEAFSAVPDALRALAAAGVVFAISGFGLVRLLLPAALRHYELLWVLPVGACAAGLAMTLLGFAAVPYPASLPLVLAGGVALAAYAVRSRGWPELTLGGLAWPAYLAVVVVVVALVPMLFVQHYAAPVGLGSDAHVATGVAQFLQHAYPTSVDSSQPINQMQPTWQSKYPIYYAFAAVSSISGLQTWQVLGSLGAALLAMAAVGMFLVAREVFEAPVAVALAAMCFAGLERIALATVLHPYFNQTWGFFALPFTLVLGWFAVRSGISRRTRQAASALLAMFGLVLVLAYPLAAPIPAVPLIVFAWGERRRTIARGDRALRVRDLYRGRRSLLWLLPAAALLAVPVAGAVDKAVGAARVLLPGHSLRSWGGDLFGFIPFGHFFSLPGSAVGTALFVVLVLLAVRGLVDRARSLAWGLGGLLLVGLALALYFRERRYGYYFEFKLLAFLGPLIVLVATVGAGRLRRVGAVCLAGLAVATAGSAFAQIKDTGFQLTQSTIQLSDWARSLPKGASVRLDMWPPRELWAGYFLASRPLCSQSPLLATDYPHVPISRKADYILAWRANGRPADAVGRPLRENLEYVLYRENPSVPGPENCSQRRLDRLYSGAGYFPK